MKFSTKKSFNDFNCIIWNKYDIKFHDFSWKIDFNIKVINNLKLKKCLQYEQLSIINNKIFIKDNLEMLNNWDLFIHDNLCNIWDIRISNIFKNNNDIYNDFILFKKYLDKLNNWDMERNCFKCIKTGYSYAK
jgi:hypothetical protein